MGYHTLIYLFLFLPLALLVYQLTPQKLRWAVLVLEGYLFFWIISGKLVIYLIAVTIFTYGIGLRLDHNRKRFKEHCDQVEREERKRIRKIFQRRQKLILLFGIGVLLSALAYLKYFNFFVANVNLFAGREMIKPRNLILPIGISFYSLQAISYMADVYWNKMPAERHPGKIALFLGFFPQIMEGPITMYGDTAQQLWEGHSLKAENLTEGCRRIGWGMLKKIVVADRLYVVVKTIFDNYRETHGVMVIFGAVAYTIQLYMEFSGCMDIIIGSGKCFGVTLPENFRQPFFSKSAAEFWRRWHISLGRWFKTYIFYPVTTSGLVKKWNLYSKKHFNKYVGKIGISALALFPVWLCNGLWHGSSWNYIFYGMFYFVILMTEIILEPVRLKCLELLHVRENHPLYSFIRMVKTWCIIFTGELFFRASGLKAGCVMFLNIFKDFEISRLWDGTLLKLGIDIADYYVIFAGILAVAIVEVIKEFHLLGDRSFVQLRLPIRWAAYYGLILAVLILGAYGNGYQEVDMIYANF